MRVLVSGASGLVGAGLTPCLEGGGHEVVPLSRRRSGGGGPSATWDPAKGVIDLAGAGRIDGVVHLAGETIAQRWTSAAKTRIRESRVGGTRLLATGLARLPEPPRVLISASATGYYGDRGDAVLDELSAAGAGFLAEVAREWEAAAEPARAAGIRVVWLRLGVVLAPHGGALGKMLTPFRLGLGGRIGSGRQFWSWIALADVVRAVSFCLEQDQLEGPVNAVSPEPVTNREFTRVLGDALGRPAMLPLPALAVRMLLGEMGEGALLASARVMPTRLAAAGFDFQYPELRGALQSVLAEPG